MTARVSMLVMNWNGRQYLRQCLDSILAQDYPNIEIILLDNGSTDGSAEFVRESYPSVTVVANTRNLGTSVGNNQAARCATGEYLFLLNNDAWFVSPDAISALVRRAKSRPTAAIIGCQVRNVDGSIQDIGVKIDPLGFPVGSTPPTPLPDVIDDLFYVTSCAMLVRANVFRELGAYDGRCFWSHEEVDLAWRARLRGYGVVTDMRVIVTHVGGGSMVGGVPGKETRYRTTTARIYHRERSTLVTLLKNYSAASLLVVLPLYAGVNVAEMLFFLLMRQPAVAHQYVRAYWWNLLHLRGTMRIRRRVQRTRRVSDREIARYFWPGIKKLSFLKGSMPRIDASATGAGTR